MQVSPLIDRSLLLVFTREGSFVFASWPVDPHVPI
jgi:hypothetical protein